MSGAKREDIGKPTVVWQDETFRITAVSFLLGTLFGGKAQEHEFRIEIRSHGAWVDYTLVPHRALEPMSADEGYRLWVSFRSLLTSLYAERYEKKGEPPAETEKQRLVAFACTSVACQCGAAMRLSEGGWPLTLTCPNPYCPFVGKSYHAPIVRLEPVDRPEPQQPAENLSEATQVLVNVAKRPYRQDGG